MANWSKITIIWEQRIANQAVQVITAKWFVLFLMDVIASPGVCRLRLREDSLRAAGQDYWDRQKNQHKEKENEEEQNKDE